MFCSRPWRQMFKRSLISWRWKRKPMSSRWYSLSSCRSPSPLIIVLFIYIHVYSPWIWFPFFLDMFLLVYVMDFHFWFYGYLLYWYCLLLSILLFLCFSSFWGAKRGRETWKCKWTFSFNFRLILDNTNKKVFGLKW